MATKSGKFSFSHNTLVVDFESIYKISNPSITEIFRLLESSGLKRFLGGARMIYEDNILEFFKNAVVEDDSVRSSVNGFDVSISETIFASFFNLPSEGISSVDSIPAADFAEAATTFSLSNETLPASGKKKLMKIQYRLLCDIVAKVLSARAGSFDDYTTNRLETMAAIFKSIQVNWSAIIFRTLKAMILETGPRKQPYGFAVQLGELLIHLGCPLSNGIMARDSRVLSLKSVSALLLKSGETNLPQTSVQTSADSSRSKRQVILGAAKKRKTQLSSMASESQCSSAGHSQSNLQEVSSAVKPSSTEEALPSDALKSNIIFKEPAPVLKTKATIRKSVIPIDKPIDAIPISSLEIPSTTEEEAILAKESVAQVVIDVEAADEEASAAAKALAIKNLIAESEAKKQAAEEEDRMEKAEKAKIIKLRTAELALRRAEERSTKEAQHKAMLRDARHAARERASCTSLAQHKAAAVSQAAEEPKESVAVKTKGKRTLKKKVADVPVAAVQTENKPEFRKLVISDSPPPPKKKKEVPGKGKGIATEDVEESVYFPTADQEALRLILEDIEERVKSRLEYFDEWANRRINAKVTAFTRCKEPETLEEQEQNILKWANTSKIQEALSRKHIIEANSRRLLTRKALQKRTKEFNKDCPTARSEARLLTKLQKVLDDLYPASLLAASRSVPSTKLSTAFPLDSLPPSTHQPGEPSSTILDTSKPISPIKEVPQQPDVILDEQQPSKAADINQPGEPSSTILDTSKPISPIKEVPQQPDVILDEQQPSKVADIGHPVEKQPPSPVQQPLEETDRPISSPSKIISKVCSDIPPSPPRPAKSSDQQTSPPHPAKSPDQQTSPPKTKSPVINAGTNKEEEPGREMTISHHIDQTMQVNEEVNSAEQVVSAKFLEDIVQTMNNLISKVDSLEERFQSAQQLPESMSIELQRISAESYAMKESARLHQIRVENAICEQNALIASQSRQMSTQAELGADQTTEIMARIDNVGMQFQEFTSYIQEKDAEKEGTSKKKRAPPPKKTPPKRQRLI